MKVQVDIADARGGRPVVFNNVKTWHSDGGELFVVGDDDLVVAHFATHTWTYVCKIEESA